MTTKQNCFYTQYKYKIKQRFWNRKKEIKLYHNRLSTKQLLVGIVLPQCKVVKTSLASSHYIFITTQG